MRPDGRPFQDEAIGKSAGGFHRFGQGQGTDLLRLPVAQALSDGHPVVVIAIIKHAPGDHRGRFLAVGQDADEALAPDQGLVESIPGPAGQGNRAHVRVRQLHPVRQQLERVERRKNHDFRIGQLPAQRIGEAEEERVARGENHHFRMAGVLREHGFQRHCDVDPLRTFRQQRRHDFVVAPAAGKDAACRDGIPHLGREPDRSVVGHSDDDEALPRHRGRVSVPPHR